MFVLSLFIASAALAVEIPFGEEPSWDLIADVCPEVLAEEYACLGLTTFPSIQLVGLETGTECFLQDMDPADISHVSTSTVWWGDHLYACSGQDGSLHRISMRDFTVDRSGTVCESAHAWNGGLLLRGTDRDWPYGEISLCEDWQDLEDDSCVSQGFEDTNYTHTVLGDELWSAWHSADRIDRLDLTTLQVLEPLVLQDHDDWIFGQSFINEDLLVLTVRDELLVVDPASGQELWRVPAPYYTAAFYCFDTDLVPEFSTHGEGGAGHPNGLGGGEGCACAAAPSSGGATGLLLGLLGLCGLRRRRL